MHRVLRQWFFVGLLATFQPAAAQVFYNLNLPRTNARAAGPQAFYVARVVDARANKNNVGWVNTGLGNARQLARFSQGLEQEVQQFFNLSFYHTPEASPLVLVVRRLGITEHAGNVQEVAAAEVVADVYIQHGPNYRLVHRAAELATAHALDVTGRHPHNIAQALRQVLAPLRPDGWAARVAEAPTHTWEQLLHAAPAPLTHAALAGAALQPGVYRTAADFQRNAPEAHAEWRVRPHIELMGQPLQWASVELRDATSTG